MAKRWFVLKPTVTDDPKIVKRIAHGDGGLGTVSYYVEFEKIINDLIELGLVQAKSDERYNIGNDVIITADGPGAIADRFGGGVRIIVPSNVLIKSFRIKGDAAWLSGNSLEIQIIGGRGSATVYNTSSIDNYHPQITVVQRTILFPGDPYVQRPHDAGGVDIFHFPITTQGVCKTLIQNITGDFEIMGQL
jgi:hypothetical protein